MAGGVAGRLEGREAGDLVPSRRPRATGTAGPAQTRSCVLVIALTGAIAERSPDSSASCSTAGAQTGRPSASATGAEEPWWSQWAWEMT